MTDLLVPDLAEKHLVTGQMVLTIGKIEENRHQIIMENGTVIPMNVIYEIESTIFDHTGY